MKKKIDTRENYKDMVTSIVLACFAAIPEHRSIKKTQAVARRIKKARRNFACGRMLAMWCDCKGNFEYEKVKKAILKHNK